MSGIDFLGFLAAILTTLSFIPQVVKTWKTGSTKDISVIWLLTFSSGVAIWLVYGYLLDSMPIMAANSATLILLMLILKVKLKNRA